MSADRRTKYWQRTRLAALTGRLPSQWEERYAELVRELGEPSDELRLPRSGWVGPTSPWTPDVLAAWPPRRLVGELQAWQSAGDWMTPTPEGVARVLTEVVAASPEPYANEATLFRSLSATYVRALLEGFAKAAKEGRPFAWRLVLELCLWLEAQKDPPNPDPTGTGDEDPHWGWSRRAVAALLSVGFESARARIPLELRTLAWDALVPLTNDPEPTVDYEAEERPGGMGPLTTSINTIRGEAMHAVVRYCLWVYRHLAEGTPATWRGFESVPEARAVLEAHLDLPRDRSRAIRAVYGQWLPWLALMDAHWVELALDTLFPLDPQLAAYYDAAWDSYITMNRLYQSVFDLASRQYARAVEQLGRERESETKLYEAPERFVAEHVLVAYLRGWIEIDERGLVARLFAAGTEEIRAHALEFVGRVLGEDELPDDMVARAQALWEWASLRELSPKELASFGWWYRTGRADETWALAQLVSALDRSGGKIEMDHAVAERLAASSGLLDQRLRAFELLVQAAPSHSWEIGVWSAELRTVLSVALRDGSTAARALALTGRVVAKGYPAFKDLLDENASA